MPRKKNKNSKSYTNWWMLPSTISEVKKIAKRRKARAVQSEAERLLLMGIEIEKKIQDEEAEQNKG